MKSDTVVVVRRLNTDFSAKVGKKTRGGPDIDFEVECFAKTWIRSQLVCPASVKQGQTIYATGMYGSRFLRLPIGLSDEIGPDLPSIAVSDAATQLHQT